MESYTGKVIVGSLLVWKKKIDALISYNIQKQRFQKFYSWDTEKPCMHLSLQSC